MKTRIKILISVVCALPTYATADVRELSQAELRSAVSQNEAIATRRLVSGVEDHTGGDVVDIRAFEVDAKVTYRIIVRHDDGKLGSIMVDGRTGVAVSPTSTVGQKVTAASTSDDETDKTEKDDDDNAPTCYDDCNTEDSTEDDNTTNEEPIEQDSAPDTVEDIDQGIMPSDGMVVDTNLDAISTNVVAHSPSVDGGDESEGQDDSSSADDSADQDDSTTDDDATGQDDDTGDDDNTGQDDNTSDDGGDRDDSSSDDDAGQDDDASDDDDADQDNDKGDRGRSSESGGERKDSDDDDNGESDE